MKTTSLVTAAILAVAFAHSSASADECDHCPAPVFAVQQSPEEYRSTMFDRSHFTHPPRTDQRVAQYAPEQPAYRAQGYYERSAFRYTQSTIGKGRNADRLNIVETWGRGAEIRPYGEWERPYRIGAQPIWMTDPRAYYYGNNPVLLSENRDHVTFDKGSRRGDDFGKRKLPKKGHSTKKGSGGDKKEGGKHGGGHTKY